MTSNWNLSRPPIPANGNENTSNSAKRLCGTIGGWCPSSLQQLKLIGLDGLASLDGLSSCVGLQALELWRLHSLTSATGLAGCAALTKLEFKAGKRNCEKLSSMPDLSSLAGLEVVGLPSHLQAWEEGGRKRFELAQ